MKKLAILLLSLLSAGCHTLDAYHPIPTLESPEAAGAQKISGRISVSDSYNLVITNDASARPPDFSNPRLNRTTAVAVQGGYGFANPVELGLRVNAMFGFVPHFVVGKFQLLGDPASSSW